MRIVEWTFETLQIPKKILQQSWNKKKNLIVIISCIASYYYLQHLPTLWFVQYSIIIRTFRSNNDYADAVITDCGSKYDFTCDMSCELGYIKTFDTMYLPILSSVMLLCAIRFFPCWVLLNAYNSELIGIICVHMWQCITSLIHSSCWYNGVMGAVKPHTYKDKCNSGEIEFGYLKRQHTELCTGWWVNCN